MQPANGAPIMDAVVLAPDCPEEPALVDEVPETRGYHGTLGLLADLHFAVAPLVFLVATVFLAAVPVGVVIVIAPGAMASEGSLYDRWDLLAIPFFTLTGGLTVLAGLTLGFGGWLLAGAMFAAGLNLRRRRRWRFCVGVAAAAGVFVPLGTALTVYALSVLMNDGVREVFDRDETPAEGAEAWP